MHMLTLTPLMLLAIQEEGITFTKILRGIPTDPAAIFIYLIVVAAGLAIWWGGRRKGG